MSKAPRWTLREIFVAIVWIAVGMALFRLANSALAQVAYHPTLAVVAWSGCGIGVGIGVGTLLHDRVLGAFWGITIAMIIALNTTIQ
jgi:hypothetical protein